MQLDLLGCTASIIAFSMRNHDTLASGQALTLMSQLSDSFWTTPSTMTCTFFAVLSWVACSAFARRDSIAHILVDYTYLLPRPFNNTFTQPFIDTNTSYEAISRRIQDAQSSAFISDSAEFDQTSVLHRRYTSSPMAPTLSLSKGPSGYPSSIKSG